MTKLRQEKRDYILFNLSKSPISYLLLYRKVIGKFKITTEQVGSVLDSLIKEDRISINILPNDIQFTIKVR